MALFFQCISVLLSPVNSLKKGIKWALIAHTVLMFSFFTIPLGIILNMTSLSYVSNREFTGGAGIFPGPFGYSGSVYNWVTILFDSMFPLNQWLADGLLVGSVSNPVAWLLNVCCSSSCIVATLFIP